MTATTTAMTTARSTPASGRGIRPAAPALLATAALVAATEVHAHAGHAGHAGGSLWHALDALNRGEPLAWLVQAAVAVGLVAWVARAAGSRRRTSVVPAAPAVPERRAAGRRGR